MRRLLRAALSCAALVCALAHGEPATPTAPGAVLSAVPAATEPAGSLEELLERVRRGSVNASAAEDQREKEFLARKEQQQAALDTARAELAAAQQRAADLERQWEKNQQQLGERQQALRQRLGTLSDVFTALATAGAPLRERLHRSPTALQFGPARELALDALLATAASGERLPLLADFESLWFELQRELTESGRVRRFGSEVVAPDGGRAPRTVVRVGRFNLVDEEGRYLEFDAGARVLREMDRQPAAREDAARFAATTAGTAPFPLDPGGVLDSSALRAAAALPTAGERLRAAGALGWITLLLGVAGVAFALYRLVQMQRLHVQVRAATTCAPPLLRLEALARTQPGLDPAALEYALHEAVLRELPALGQGLAVLRAIGTLAPLFGVLGTVVTLAAPALPWAAPQASDLAQALLGAVLGLCAGIPVLALHAVLVARARGIGQRIDEHAAALVAARASGRDA